MASASGEIRFHVGFPSPTIKSIATRDWSDLAARCERLGYDCLWHSNERFFREMFVRMTVSTLATSSIGIGGAIAEPFAVHPAVTAQALATVHELSRGRASIAMGAGGSGFPMMGIERRRSARALREAVTIIRGLVAGETVTVDGEMIQARGARLHFQPPTPPPPVWVATRGDLTLRMAGEVADGAFIATYAQSAEVQGALGQIERGMDQAGRAPGDLRLMVRVDTCVHPDPARTYDGSRLMIARLLWTSYPDRNFVRRAGLEVPPELEAVIARRDYDALDAVAHLVPDEFVTAFCWAGTPADVARRVAMIVLEAGIKEIGFWVLCARGQTVNEAVELIAGEVIPMVRAELAASGSPVA